ncbi:uncharacterized protein [Watersipora subatra]|uniref:uncharacterized protein isoform X2 n=1 Tax=Watersipora subatra TaxID=2589382 RepID=UPI00355C4D0B
MAHLSIIFCFLLIGFESLHGSTVTNPVKQSICEGYESSLGVQYDTSLLCKKPIRVDLLLSEGSYLIIDIARKSVKCGEKASTHACIHVPGLAPMSVGHILSIKSVDEDIPSSGLRISITQGSQCLAQPHKNFSTSIHVKCPSDHEAQQEETTGYKEVTVREGVGQHLCEYSITIVSKAGCPFRKDSTVAVTAVTGCIDTYPSQTRGCSARGGFNLTLHGIGFLHLRSDPVDISFGHVATCEMTVIINDWTIECQVRVPSPRSITNSQSYKITLELIGDSDISVDVAPRVSVSFRASPDFEQLFSNLQQFGVGGMRRQAMEIYQKVFLTRVLPAHLTRELGLSHVNGFILYGRSGTGKTLLARTIALILDAPHVHMINSPDLSKYMGDSGSNLEDVFAQALEDAQQLSHNSPFHVVILDEIDAICEPKNKENDRLTNQLHRKLESLSHLNNLLVIGLTERFELLDPSMLRPGRFEVSVELTLPDLLERKEILEIHLSAAADSRRLADDVNIDSLGQQTEGFTPAQLAGLVRQALSGALARVKQDGGKDSLMVNMSDFHTPMSKLTSRKNNLSATACSAYSSLQDVMNSSSTLTALVQVERYGIITPCLTLLLEQQGYYVKAVTPEEVLENPWMLQSLHRIGKALSSKVAIILVDLCYMLNSCATLSSGEMLHSFLLSMRTFTQPENGKDSLLVGICPSHCQIENLKPHFNYLFGMVSAGPLTTYPADVEQKTNTTQKK